MSGTLSGAGAGSAPAPQWPGSCTYGAGAPRASTGAATFVVALVVALVIGALTSLGQTYLHGALNALVNSASAWLVAPFAFGAATASLRAAAAIGLLVCLVQLVGYELTAELRGFAAATSLALF